VSPLHSGGQPMWNARRRPETANFFTTLAAQKAVVAAVSKEKRLDFRRQAPIRVGICSSILEIGPWPSRPRQDDGGAGLPGVVAVRPNRSC